MEPLRNVIAEEWSKITVELKEFRQDVNKDISKIESRLTGIGTKLNVIEQNNLQLHKELTNIKTRMEQGERGVQGLRDSIRALEDDFDNTGVELEELQVMVENADNGKKE